MNALTDQYQKAKEHRGKLDKIFKQITQAEDAATEALADSEADLKQLQIATAARQSTYINWVGPFPLPGKRFLEQPILDAVLVIPDSQCRESRRLELRWPGRSKLNVRLFRCSAPHWAGWFRKEEENVVAITRTDGIPFGVVTPAGARVQR